MVTISSVVETTAVLSEEQDKRYEYTKLFKNEKGKTVLLIMLNASGNNQIHAMDNTTNLTINNLSELGYTTVTVWNLFPEITAKLNPKNVSVDDDNLNYLKSLLKKKFDTVVIGWGSSFSTNSKVVSAKEKVHMFLKPYEDSLVQIEDKAGRYKGKGVHPLFAGLYFNHEWVLSKYIIPEPVKKASKEKETVEDKKEPMEDRKEPVEDKKEVARVEKNVEGKPDRKTKQGEWSAMYANHEIETSGTHTE